MVLPLVQKGGKSKLNKEAYMRVQQEFVVFQSSSFAAEKSSQAEQSTGAGMLQKQRMPLLNTAHAYMPRWHRIWEHRRLQHGDV
jgi:hypothetical protein